MRDGNGEFAMQNFYLNFISCFIHNRNDHKIEAAPARGHAIHFIIIFNSQSIPHKYMGFIANTNECVSRSAFGVNSINSGN